MQTQENKNQVSFEMPPSLNRQVDEVDLTMANGNLEIILNFNNCTFISVDGLEWLEELLLRAQSLNAQVKLQAVKPSVYKVFKVARIDSVLKACGSAVSGPVC
ncbi:MAG: hypothetical protein K2X27_18585 [Candidatus Obscuribacterales bacterium]|nr:hypothetical protein [Candidatus Obscuribacterales bacterium]